MKKFFILMITILMLAGISCGKNAQAKHIKQTKQVKRLKKQDMCEINGLVYSKYEKRPFTGELYDLYPNGKMKSTTEICNGKVHGKATRYYNNGRVQTEGKFKDGKPEGNYTEYDRRGRVTKAVSYKTLY